MSKIEIFFFTVVFKSVNLSILQKTISKLANLLMHSQCALSGPISSSRKTRKLTVCRFILEEIGPDRAHCECMRRFASLLIVFCKIDKLTLLNTKLINTLIKINYSLSTFAPVLALSECLFTLDLCMC
jgi:hypothetical protein